MKIKNAKNLSFYLTPLFSAFILLFFLDIRYTEANSMKNVNVTVSISICGNKIIEGGEDCEGGNLNGQTCESIGYGPGTLSCDIACSFDTYSCSPAPTPTHTPNPTHHVSTTTTSLIPKPITTTSSPSPTTKSALPAFLIPFDPDGDGKIALTDIYIVAKDWVEKWRQAILEETIQGEGVILTKKEWGCDLNGDGRCDLKDFSVLLFYVGR